ncbi:MAG: HAD family hydrolase [Saprospiraceae bacterium]|nr:HAD family hydrolase [Saprospiraceae bacterium]
MEIAWIFFDCFNTLIDDFDQSGDESGVIPLGVVAKEAGWCQDPTEFHHAYLSWRRSYWDGSHWRELSLEDRLTHVLDARKDRLSQPLTKVVRSMVDLFFESFPPSVRLTPGVESMLEKLQGKVKMGVVSNFFVPGMPEALLTNFGLHHFFDFILDSAQVGLKKPHPEIYQTALGKTDLLSNETSKILFVGDSLQNDYYAPRTIKLSSLFFDRSKERPSPPAQVGIDHIQHWDQFEDYLS